MERALIACKRSSRHRPITRSILLTMRLTTAIILIGALQISANGLAQKISFSGTNVPLSKVFHIIEEQTGYGVLIAKSTLESAKPVTINTTNGSLDEVLKTCFSFQPWKLQYTISGRTIAISKVVEKIVPGQVVGDAQREISGIVRNDEGSPLVGATVEVKGLNKRGLTNEKGEFTLKNVPNGIHKVEISFVGYENFVTEGTVEDNVFRLVAELKRSTNILDQTQVIAYGTTTRRFSTGNVTTVKAADIEKQPVNNPLLALEGRVPGVFITQGSGVPGAGVTVRIQGQNSIANGNDPFYVVDGVPYTAEWFSTLNDNILSGGGVKGNPLSYINPDDIESIDVLKDADATAIYGSRAANGAILITTKKGKIGQTKIGINLQQGWGQITRKLKMLNTQQYLAMRQEAYRNDGISSIPSSAYDLTLWDTTRYTDWQKVLIGGNAQYTDANATISGGTDNTQYMLSGTYRRETTVFPGNFSDQKGAVHFNLNSASTNGKFHIQFSGNYVLDYSQLPWQDPTGSAENLEPDAPALFKKDGTLNWEPNSSGSSTWKNPLAQLLYNTYTNKTTNLVSSAILSYHILPGLDIKSSFAYTNMQTNDYTPSALTVIRPELRPNSMNSAGYGNRNFNSWTIEPQINYKKNISNGKLDLLVGSTILQSNNGLSWLLGRGYPSDQVLENTAAAATVYPSSIISKYKYNALFGRINYNLFDKYIIDLNARRDGSSRFGSGNEFHNFGSIGAAWIFGEEPLIKRSRLISFGKLRGSYGITGNDQIGNYQFISLYNFTQNLGQLYQGGTGLVASGLPNPYLQWEETRKMQAGIDLGFLKDRILLNVTYGRNRSSNQLLSYSLPSITGFNSIMRNFPATVQNITWEYTLNSTNIKTTSFSWATSINITIPKNELVSFPNLATSSYSSKLIIGQPVSVIKAFQFLGVDPGTGAYKFASKTDPFKPKSPDDLTGLINTLPKFYGGFQNNIKFKQVELSMLFQFVKQVGPNIYFGNGGGIPPGYFSRGQSNQPVAVLNHWQKPGDVAPIAKYSSNYTNGLSYILTSNAAYSDASYIRLKNIALSWQFSDAWNKKLRVQNCNIFFLAQNLLTFTKYKGSDPENQSNQSLPPLRVFTFGFRMLL